MLINLAQKQIILKKKVVILFLLLTDQKMERKCHRKQGFALPRNKYLN